MNAFCSLRFFLLVILPIGHLHAQTPDSFNPNSNGTVNSFSLQPDGKIMVGGSFTTLDGVARSRIARLNADGTLDVKFDLNANNDVYSFNYHPDGRILIGGNFTAIGGVVRNRIARLNADGTVDLTFNPNANGAVQNLTMLADGKILIGGSFSSVGGVARNRIARLNADGTLDTSFNPNANSIVRSLVVQLDGKILIGGSFSMVGGVVRNSIARLNADGTLDTSFDPNASSDVTSLALQADGKILIGGSFTAVGGVDRSWIARLHADGTLDTLFDPSPNSRVSSFALQADGKILIGGFFTNVGGVSCNYVARLNADGTLDGSMNPNASSTVHSVVLQADGRILLGGSFSTVGGVTRNRIARLANNIPATQTLTVTGANQIVWQRGGSAPEVAEVAFETWNGSEWVSQGAAVRETGGWSKMGLSLPASSWVRARGFITSGYLNGSGGLIEQVATYGGGGFPDIAVAADGGGLVSGSGKVDFGTVEWPSSGSTKTFEITNEGDSPLTGLVISISGAHAGDFAAGLPGTTSLAPGGITSFTVVFSPLGVGKRFAELSIASSDVDESPFHINLNGTGLHWDPTFDPNVNTVVQSLALQADGKILIGGSFTYVDGAPRGRIARLNEDGTLDHSVYPNADGSVRCLAVQADGKILIGGQFNTVGGVLFNIGGVTRNRIARLNLDGTPDASFNPDANGTVNSVAVQLDGKILIGGEFTSVGGETRNRIARLHADGTLDSSFNPDANGTLNSLTMQADGEILIGGSFTNVGGVARNRIARLHEDGALDTSFNPDANGTVNCVVVQADGNVLLGGGFTSVGGVSRNRIARVNAGGTLDASFNPNLNDSVLSLALQADGEILVGGLFTTVDGVVRNRIARLDGGGTLDATFDPSASSAVNALTLQADGKILVGGGFTSLGGVVRNQIARLPNNIVAAQTLTVTGTSQIDWQRGGSAPELERVTFETWNGSAWVSEGAAARETGGWRKTGLSLPASTWVRARGFSVGGYFSGSGGLIEQITTYGGGAFPDVALAVEGANLDSGTGTVDFGTVEWGAAGDGKSFTITNEGDAPLTGLEISISGAHPGDFVVGSLGSNSLAPGASTFFLVTFSPHGGGDRSALLSLVSGDVDESPIQINLKGRGFHLDSTFDPNPNGNVRSIAIQTDGKILISGGFNSVGGESRYGVARLNSDGTLDMFFDPNVDGSVGSIALQTDGRILIGGYFSAVGGVERNSIARLHADGTLDTFFDPNVDGSIRNLVLQADGKIIIGGSFNMVGGVVRNSIARLHADGTLDATFNPNVNDTINSLAVQADGKIVIGGDFIAVGGVARNRIARLNADGSLDASFNPDADYTVYSLAVQADEKILVGGGFDTLGGVARKCIARLNADGALDEAFNPSVYGEVLSSVVQTDGKILIGGIFTSVGTVARFCVARLHPDGLPDMSFDPNVNSEVFSLAMQADGRILVGGSISAVGGVPRNRFARLPNNIAATQTLGVTHTSQIDWVRGGSTPEVENVTFESWDGSAWVNQGFATRIAGGWQKTGLSLPASSWVRARGSSRGGQYNGGSSQIEQITAYGAGSFPDIAIDDNEQNDLVNGNSIVDFGRAAVGSSLDLTFTIRNTGDAALSGLAATCSTTGFAASGPLATTVAPGESTTFTVTFSPVSIGFAVASLSIASNDAGESPFVIQITGTATTPTALFTTTIASSSTLTGDDALPDAIPFDDGVSNLLKYAFNMNLGGPDVSTLPPGTGTSGLPVITTPEDAPVGTIQVEFLRRKGSGLIYTPQKTSSLDSDSWTPLNATPFVTPIPGNDLFERVTYEEPPAPIAAPACFGRVSVSVP